MSPIRKETSFSDYLKYRDKNIHESWIVNCFEICPKTAAYKHWQIAFELFQISHTVSHARMSPRLNETRVYTRPRSLPRAVRNARNHVPTSYERVERVPFPSEPPCTFARICTKPRYPAACICVRHGDRSRVREESSAYVCVCMCMCAHIPEYEEL